MALDTAKAVTSLNILTQKFDNAALAYTPFYPQVCTIVQSERATEDYAWLGNVPGIREWVGERVFKQLRAAKWEVTNKLWETSLDIEKTDIEDDRLNMYGPMLEAEGEEFAKHPDERLLGTLIANGGSALCFDGQYFFDTDHSWGDSGTQSNALTYDVVNTGAATAAEWQASFEQALTTMLAYKNDQGKYFHRAVVGPQQGLIAVVPLAMWKPATVALQAQIISQTTNLNLSIPTLLPCPYLSSTVWHLYSVSSRLRPFVFQSRRPIQRQMKGMDDREFKDVKFMADARYELGYLAWWNAVQTTFV